MTLNTSLALVMYCGLGKVRSGSRSPLVALFTSYSIQSGCSSRCKTGHMMRFAHLSTETCDFMTKT